MTVTARQPQHMLALGKAQRVRLGRAELHRSVASLPRQAGCARVAELLTSPPDILGTLAIIDLLQWPRGIGRSQARAILRQHGPMGEQRQVRSLTARQRMVLVEHFRDAAVDWDRRAR